jgi:uncharacterized membrane protein
MRNYSIFVLAIFGIAIALHVWIQTEKGNDGGCIDIGTYLGVEVNCSKSALQKASLFFGLSPSILGYLFYWLLGTLALGNLVMPLKHARMCRIGIDVSLGAAIPYTWYLMYLQFSAHTVCPYCILSALIVHSIGLLHVSHIWRRCSVFPDEMPAKSSIGCAVCMIFASVGLFLTVAVIFNRLGVRPLNEKGSAREFELLFARTMPKFFDKHYIGLMQPCIYENPGIKIDSSSWQESKFEISTTTSSSPAVVAFLDPYCGHCGAAFSELSKLLSTNAHGARLYLIPVGMERRSERVVQALEIAGMHSKYFAMWTLWFQANQSMRTEERFLRDALEQLGISGEAFDTNMASMEPRVQKLRSRVQRAGIVRTPSIFIDGRSVEPRNINASCLSTLLQRLSPDG